MICTFLGREATARCMSAIGIRRRKMLQRTLSANGRLSRHVRFVPILLQKSPKKKAAIGAEL